MENYRCPVRNRSSLSLITKNHYGDVSRQLGIEHSSKEFAVIEASALEIAKHWDKYHSLDEFEGFSTETKEILSTMLRKSSVPQIPGVKRAKVLFPKNFDLAYQCYMISGDEKQAKFIANLPESLKNVYLTEGNLDSIAQIYPELESMKPTLETCLAQKENDGNRKSPEAV